MGVVVVKGADDVDEVIGDASRLESLEEKETSQGRKGVREIEEDSGRVLTDIGGARHGGLDFDDVVGAVFLGREASLVAVNDVVPVPPDDASEGRGDEFVVCVGE